jgi:hypothetical protein
MIRASRLARCCCLVKLLVLDESIFILDAILSIYIVYAPILVGGFLLRQLIVTFVIMVTWSSADAFENPVLTLTGDAARQK